MAGTKPKKIWYSKSAIFGVLQLSAGMLALLAGSELIRDNPQAVAIIAMVSGAVTIGIRLLTSLPVEW